MLWYSSFNSDHLLPATEAAGWPVERWRETRDEWDAETQKYTRVTIERRKTGPLALTPAPFRLHRRRHQENARRRTHGDRRLGEHLHRQTRYYRSGKDNMERGLGYFD